jgi:PPK2 family polyphosphate:nucleotide phosphotransferase
MDVKRYRVRPGDAVDLRVRPTDETKLFDGGKAKGREKLITLNERLAELQLLLFAEAKHRVLVVLQGMDTSGKDGTIRHVFKSVNPQGVKVASFKRPNETELAHDYLWRIHSHVPGDGHLTIFNRSHYEDVLVVRVHDLAPKPVWHQRFQHIREFERMLADEGTVIRKIFLHISRAEQKQRLEERLANPVKNWKFEQADVQERRLWDNYRVAYEDALAETSTDQAPWYVVPADRKWYRNLVISEILIKALESLKMSYPPPLPDLGNVIIDD